jgi:tetratricopeptide (TPR) repeat protein
MEKRTTGPQTLEAAITLHGAGKLKAAADIYASLLAQGKDNPDAAYGLGTILIQKGQIDQALPLLDQARRARPVVPAFAFSHAWALARLDRVEEATRGFMRAAELAAGDTAMLVDMCSRLVALNYIYEAIDILTATSERTPGSREIWLALAQALGKAWQLKAAIPAFERALALPPPAAEDLLAYADLLFLARQPAAAKRAILQARELGADDPATLYLQARCEGIAGNPEHERRLLQEAIAVNPTFGSAWELLLETTGSDELEDFADDCVRLANEKSATSDDRARLRYAAGRALDRRGDFDRAFAQFDKANRCQRDAARARGLAYNRDDVEQFIKQIQSDFDGSHAKATGSSTAEQPIFIVGMVRSGTTVVEHILGGLDGVSMGGEADAIEVVASKYYWSVNRDQAKPIRDLDTADWDKLAAEYWQLQTVPKSRVTDKMPLNFRHIGLICAMFPGAPIIYMQRDPRDVALSIYSRYFSDGHYYATELANIAHFIGASQRLMAHWKKAYPDRILELGFEQLVAKPEPETRRLARFCGLEWQPNCLDFHQRDDASYTFSEAQVREPLNTKGIGRWRRYADKFAPFIDALVENDVRLPDE